MYNEQIKEILMKTYDVCAYTLDCGSSAVRGKKLYYYTLDNGELYIRNRKERRTY